MPVKWDRYYSMWGASTKIQPRKKITENPIFTSLYIHRVNEYELTISNILFVLFVAGFALLLIICFKAKGNMIA